MKPVSKSKLGPSEKSNRSDNSSTNHKIGEEISKESQNLTGSKAEKDFSNHEVRNAKLLKKAHKSSQDFGALAVSLHESTKSHMEFMQAAWKQMMENQTAMRQENKESQSKLRQEIKESQSELRQEIKESQTELQQEIKDLRQENKESQAMIQNDIKIIKHDLHDSNGHLANTIKKSEERTIIAIKELIANSEEIASAKTDEKISKNNLRLLVMFTAIGVAIGSAAISLGKWLFVK